METIVRYRNFYSKQTITPIFKELIDSVIDLLISHCEDRTELLQQYTNLCIEDIIFTGAGFYCNFAKNDAYKPLSIKHSTFGDVFGTVNNEPVGFILHFYDKEYIGALECYTEYIPELVDINVTENRWENVNEIKNYRLYKRESNS